ncbi:MAG: hypothetical protein WDN26_15015 [Chitinophagaceae bacterium]
MRLASILALCCLLLSCNSTSPNKKFNVQDTARFKSWLSDTIAMLKSGKDLNDFNVSEDSLYLEIKSTYSQEIDSSYEGNNADLIYAMDLLTRNNCIPKSKVGMDLKILHFYTASFVPELVYDFDSKISTFNLNYPDSIIQFSFVKGNMTDKKIVRRNQGGALGK